MASRYFPSFSNSNPSSAGPNFDCVRNVSTAACNLVFSSAFSTSFKRASRTSWARKYCSDSAKHAASRRTLSVFRSSSTNRRERAIAALRSRNSAKGPLRERRLISPCRSFAASDLSVETPWEIALVKSAWAAVSSCSFISQKPRRIRIQGISGAFAKAAV